MEISIQIVMKICTKDIRVKDVVKELRIIVAGGNEWRNYFNVKGIGKKYE